MTSRIGVTELEPGDTLLTTIRHGLTELNRDKRVGGQVDMPLIDEGRAQTEEARRVFDGTPFDVVMVSPLGRAIETAEILTGWPRDRFVVEERCTERSFGAMEGLHPWEVRARHPQVAYLYVEHIGYSLNPPGGESFEDLQERARDFLEQTLGRFAGQRILVFSHQNFMQQLHGVLRGLGPIESLQYDILNCELNEFRIAADGALLGHRTLQLVPSAADHPSF